MLESELFRWALESTCVYFVSRIINFTSISVEVGLQIGTLNIVLLMMKNQTRNSIGWESCDHWTYLKTLLSEYKEAYETLFSGTACKIVLDPTK